MILYYFIEFQSHSMNELGKRVFRRQAFRDAWLQDPDFASWLQKCDDPYKASCTACKRSFIAGKSELLKHKKTLTHTIRMRKRRGEEEEEEEEEDERQMVHNMSECNVENYIERNDNNEETIIVLESNASTSRDAITDMNESIIKRRKCTETEEELKILRMKSIIQREQQLALVKLHHEERMAVIKEEHVKKINQLEIKATLAKVELAELLLKKEKARMSNYNS
ncbi:uncharacterized protein LOC143378381 isoform X2 [Andrena cerasifolii]|uniref:uncharacterized protein LOC143378381 isoform X2 n=1 Tax=Andrena cerasifolii TaxID=2819439 RepID=UPI004037C12A